MSVVSRTAFRNLVLEHFGAIRGDSNYIHCIDFNGDGFIDVKDIVLVASHLGEKVPGEKA